MEKYFDRLQAGKKLADALQAYAHQPDVIVLALPRGGVPVAYEIATKLAVPLDVFLVRKLGVPGHEELAMGAIASGNTLVINEDVMRTAGITMQELEQERTIEKKELSRREKVYRGNRPPLDVKNKRVILVDDGIATGATMRVAIKALRSLEPEEIIVAVPVAAQETARTLSALVDHFISLQIPNVFYAVGAFYDDFPQTEDQEVFDLLSQSRRE